MSGFDDPGIFYSDSFGGDPGADEGQARKSQLQRRFKEFLRQYRVGTDRTGFTFKYRWDRLREAEGGLGRTLWGKGCTALGSGVEGGGGRSAAWAPVPGVLRGPRG